MRTTTKRKVWGRNQTIAAIRTAIHELEKALATNTETRNEAIAKVLKDLQFAAEGMDIYKVDRRRLRAAIEREKGHLETLLEQAKAVPVTMEEKALARVAKQKQKDVRGNKRLP